MSEEMVPIRSVKHYFNQYIVENQKDLRTPSGRSRIKLQLLDAFSKEIFEQFMIRFGPSVMKLSRDEMANLPGVQNILKNEFRKWRRLCMICTDAGLVNWLGIEDLKRKLEETEEESENEKQEQKMDS